MNNENELSATEEFLNDIEPEQTESILDAPLIEETTEKPSEEEDKEFKNRKERRKQLAFERLQTEREANIALTERLRVLTESQNVRTGAEEADYLKRIERIYGDATPEAREATQLLKEAMLGLKESAKQELRTEAENRRSEESKALQQEEQKLDQLLESLEDAHDLNLTTGPDRKGFLTLLEKLSPKDRDGNIIEYADPESTLEMYLSRKEKAQSRAKDLASRSMTRGGSSQPSRLEESTLERFLKDNDII